jgi:hypothetical protein
LTESKNDFSLTPHFTNDRKMYFLRRKNGQTAQTRKSTARLAEDSRCGVSARSPRTGAFVLVPKLCLGTQGLEALLPDTI